MNSKNFILFLCCLSFLSYGRAFSNTVKPVNTCSVIGNSPCDTSKGVSCITVPNVFSPNNDGKNDVFKIISSGLTSMTCSIYNRWGIKLWDLKYPEESWDGRDLTGISCTSGTYYYILDASGLDGKSYHQTGYLQLIR